MRTDCNSICFLPSSIFEWLFAHPDNYRYFLDSALRTFGGYSLIERKSKQLFYVCYFTLHYTNEERKTRFVEWCHCRYNNLAKLHAKKRKERKNPIVKTSAINYEIFVSFSQTKTNFPGIAEK